ncbi:TetR/AcrR family transcriptional regulator [Streptomyces tritici]|uniref:TetR/AcrR family transcriptional regulator n=1 Tax=Streptomyces tritici TaxID=2054410 RepID=UPI003AEF6975
MFEENRKGRPPGRASAQRRGIERRRAIVDAAEALLTEGGYEAATLKAISARVGIPITSVYHYFSDRHQVEIELLTRHVRALDEIVAGSLDDPGVRTLGQAVDAVADPVLEYLRRHRSCAELWFRGRDERIEDVVGAFDRAQAERLRGVLVERGLLAADTSPRVLEFALEAANRLFDLAFRASPTGDDATLDEARRLVTAYLGTYAGPEATGRG